MSKNNILSYSGQSHAWIADDIRVLAVLSVTSISIVSSARQKDMANDTGYLVLHLLCAKAFEYLTLSSSYPGVTAPIATTESSAREKAATVTLMEELRR